MRICGLQKLSLLDYPEKTAVTVFIGGCNLRCPFCHNAALVTQAESCPEISQSEFFSFLETRRGKLDGVCISGGEPLLHAGLEDFIRHIREKKDFLIKLDTNGFFPEKLRSLIDARLLDYVAMDVKNSPKSYAKTVGVLSLDLSPVLESISLLKEGRVPYEFRTTLVKGLHNKEDLQEIGALLQGAAKYFLQSFADSGSLVGFGSHENACEMSAFSVSELEELREIVSPFVPSVSVRGR